MSTGRSADSQPVPVPLSPSSRKLADHRYHAWVGGPVFGPEKRRAMIGEGRFVKLREARRWADATYPDADIVTVDLYRAPSWNCLRKATRREGIWYDGQDNPIEDIVETPEVGPDGARP